DPGLTRVDLHLEMPVEYTQAQNPDEYRCFLIDWPSTTNQYVTGFRANPGNSSVVHHAIAFLIQPEDVATYQQLDAADLAPGYTCFGGPGGPVEDASWVGAWAPGTPGTMYPADTGLLVRPGSKIALQVHYNS